MRRRVDGVRRATPAGAGAIAVIEVSGASALARLAALVPDALGPPGSIRHARLALGGEELDEVLVVRRAADAAELHVTGSPPLVDEVLAWLRAGADERGDDARSLSIEEQADELLAAARSEAAARILLDQREGALRSALEELRALDDPRAIDRALDDLIARGARASHALHPRLVVIAGPVNAGKSTLFNVLVGEERVLVADEPGTTRDAIREPATLGAWPVELVDTAGEREDAEARDAGAVERLGRARGEQLAAAADVVLWLRPAGGLEPRGAHARHPRLCVLTSKADREAPGVAGPAISALERPEHARATVAAIFRAALELPDRAWEPGAAVPFTVEQMDRLRAARAACERGERERLLDALLASG